MIVLITGANGSGASYLIEHIIFNDHLNTKVHGLSRWHSTSTPKNLRHCIENMILHECDMTDFSNLYSKLKLIMPDLIFNFASHANVRACWTNPISVCENNNKLMLNLLESIRLLTSENKEYNPRLVQISSSEVYGIVSKEDIPIKEFCPQRPGNPYAVSKLFQDQLCHVYHKAYNLDIVITRMFSYFNPRRDDLFTTSFAKQIVDIENRKSHILRHGNLESVRTLIDVRDAMDCYWKISKYGKPGEAYNLGGQNTMTVGEFLEILKTHAKKEIKSEVDPILIRPLDVTLQIPDISKFESVLPEKKWIPRYTLNLSISHLLTELRENKS